MSRKMKERLMGLFVAVVFVLIRNTQEKPLLLAIARMP